MRPGDPLAHAAARAKEESMSDPFDPPPPPEHHRSWHVGANLMAGVLTAIPAIIVWVVLSFIFEVLSKAGGPIIRWLIGHLPPESAVRHILDNPYAAWIAAIVVALVFLYFLGALASRVVGQQLIAAFEKLIERIPFVQAIYSASKQLVGALRKKPGGPARVVLVDFPNPGTKAIGLVMRNYRDKGTGEEMAAVFTPTAPNPTSGYLLMVPVKLLVTTDMSMDQAMTMIVSGGAVAPPYFSGPNT
jgi:uncharacterized membrane protein